MPGLRRGNGAANSFAFMVEWRRTNGVVPANAGTHNHKLQLIRTIHPRDGTAMYDVHILASGRHGTLYIGVTNALQKRLEQHRNGNGSLFVKKYGVFRLVYVESYDHAKEAITREKQLKRWKRDWKIELIERDNLEWCDLSDLIV
jgi:putative endonuclease